MSNHIQGRTNITLDPVTVAAVRPADAFAAAAEAIVPAVGMLASTAISPVPGALLAGHALECLLKATLSHLGVTEEELKKNFGHDLEALWRKATAPPSPFTPAIPKWVETLNGLHDQPFTLRYPIGLHGLVLPNAVEVARELKDLLDSVSKLLQDDAA